jgi:hypothetical protein
VETVSLKHRGDRYLSERRLHRHDPAGGNRQRDCGKRFSLKIRQGARYARTGYFPDGHVVLDLRLELSGRITRKGDLSNVAVSIRK